MGDVYVRLRRLPLEATLKGERWSIGISPLNKSGKKVELSAYCRSPYRAYRLWSGQASMVDEVVQRGFRVAAGTPERGLVTELRRAGLAELALEPRPAMGLEEWGALLKQTTKETEPCARST